MTFINIVLSLFILSFIVFFHELFHFLAAKILKIKTYDFSVGMGPKLFSYQKLNGKKTFSFLNKNKIDPNFMSYHIRMLPIGGFIAFANPSLEKPVDELKKVSPWKRIIVAFAGPLGNFVLAILAIFLFLNLNSYNGEHLSISEIQKGSIAEKSNLMIGDEIVKINNKEVSKIDDLNKYIDYKKTNCFVISNKKTKDICIQTKKPNEKIGLSVQEGSSFFETIPNSFKVFYQSSINYINVFIEKIFKLDVKEMSGPVGAVDVMQQHMNSFNTMLSIFIMLNLGLGIANLLLPLSITDGGKILIDFIAILFRKHQLNTTWLDILCILIMVYLMAGTAFFDVKDILKR